LNWEKVAASGKNESPHRAAFAQVICVGETDQEAEELYAKHCDYFYNRCLHVYTGFADPPGYRTVDTIKKGALNQYKPLTPDDLGEIPWKQLLDGRHIVAGSRDTVVEKMEELAKSLHVGHVFGLFAVGNIPNELVRHSSKLFAEKCMPRLRNIFPEWKKDDHWWCKPLEGRRAMEDELSHARTV
jgi:alkanesulfonate monooxygenase SsuD/methylene tetrahydromethanopterin reductase-like flavin-dependent oxidoreductase (luciferase family)